MKKETPLKDKDYNLVSTLYHCLQGAEHSTMYMEDARAENDKEVEDFFKDSYNHYNQLAERAKKLLGGRIK